MKSTRVEILKIKGKIENLQMKGKIEQLKIMGSSSITSYADVLMGGDKPHDDFW